jgi:hypothetical protein
MSGRKRNANKIENPLQMRIQRQATGRMESGGQGSLMVLPEMQREADMKETIIALIVTIAIGVTILTAIHQGRAVTDLERHIAMLEREVEVRQSMLDDAHTLYQQMERRIAVVDTGMSARQMLWHIEEIAATSACIEVHQ